MIIKCEQASGECDDCGTPDSATHGCLAQGATGRVCVVMWICEPCAIEWAKGEENILTAKQARDQLHDHYGNHPNVHADF